jgi:hypothetical protein
MNNPYLIQRAKFDNNPSRSGIDKLLSFDYMGSAEFEFGALGKSLARIRKDIGEYNVFKYTFTKTPDKTVSVLCRKDQNEFIPEILEKLAENKFRLKEYCDLIDFLNPTDETKKYRSNNDFWWDIDNDWFFWKQDDNFDTLLSFCFDLKITE